MIEPRPPGLGDFAGQVAARPVNHAQPDGDASVHGPSTPSLARPTPITEITDDAGQEISLPDARITDVSEKIFRCRHHERHSNWLHPSVHGSASLSVWNRHGCNTLWSIRAFHLDWARETNIVEMTRRSESFQYQR